jgi:NTE family protein
VEPRPGIALALSSGGARGFVHIGILKVLDRHGIPIVGIAGSSMGALIGALYCSGYTGGMLEEIALEVRRSHYLDFSFSKMGFVAGRKLHAMVTRLTGGRRFEDCHPPLKVVAVDIERAEEVVIDQGPLADGVRASASVPGMFSPVQRDGRLLVDGGVLNRVPVDLARTFPASGVVAVDVGVDLAPRVTSVFDVLFQTFDIMAR